MTYKEYETKGRKKLKAEFDNAECEMMYEFTNERYDSIDCFATACTGQRYAIEIKDRDISIDKYNKIMLEVIKYDALMTAYKESGYTPVFRVYYRDGELTWNVSKLKNVESRIREMSCAASTQNYQHKVKKKIIMLEKEEAIDQRRNNRENR